MTTLSLESDRTVRQAVDAYLAGANRLSLEGEAYFETCNSRYRLIDGVLFHVGRGASNDGSLIGAELVGWLYEFVGGSHVDLAWRPGARGVLVDPRRSQHIIITSATRTFVPPRAGSRPPQGGSHQTQPPPAALVSPTLPPPPLVPSFQPAAPRAEATGRTSPPTPHRTHIPPCPPTPAPREASSSGTRRTDLTQLSPSQQREPSRSDIRAQAPVHRPPRPIREMAAVAARPLPYPSPPPPRPAPVARATQQPAAYAHPAPLPAVTAPPVRHQDARPLQPWEIAAQAIPSSAIDTGHDMPLPLSASARKLSQMHGQRSLNHQRGMLLR